MAFAATQIARFNNVSVWDVTVDDDVTTVGGITHLLPSIPREITLCPLLDVFYAARWFVSSIGATSINITKTAGAGTSNPSPQMRVIVATLRSIQQAPGR